MARLFPNKCLVCGKKFHSRRNASSYCSNAHRQKAYRDKTYTPHPAPVQDSRNHRRLAKSTKPRRKTQGHARPATRRNAKRKPNKRRGSTRP